MQRHSSFGSPGYSCPIDRSEELTDREFLGQGKIVNRLDEIDEHIIEATQGELNLTSVLALCLMGASAFQMSRKRVFPAATTLLSDALRV